MGLRKLILNGEDEMDCVYIEEMEEKSRWKRRRDEQKIQVLFAHADSGTMPSYLSGNPFLSFPQQSTPSELSFRHILKPYHLV